MAAYRDLQSDLFLLLLPTLEDKVSLWGGSRKFPSFFTKVVEACFKADLGIGRVNDLVFPCSLLRNQLKAFNVLYVLTERLNVPDGVGNIL